MKKINKLIGPKDLTKPKIKIVKEIKLDDLKNHIPNDLFESGFLYDDIDNLKKLNENGLLVFGQCNENEPIFDGNCFLFINKLDSSKFIDNIIANQFAFTNQKPKTIYAIDKFNLDGEEEAIVGKTDIYSILFNTIPYINRIGSFGDMNEFDQASKYANFYQYFDSFFKKLKEKKIIELLNYFPITNNFKNKSININRSITISYFNELKQKKNKRKFIFLQIATIVLSVISIILTVIFYCFPKVIPPK